MWESSADRGYLKQYTGQDDRGSECGQEREAASGTLSPETHQHLEDGEMRSYQGRRLTRLAKWKTDKVSLVPWQASEQNVSRRREGQMMDQAED